jgi:uncharacterized protein YjbI with pentapeptide repeats
MHCVAFYRTISIKFLYVVSMSKVLPRSLAAIVKRLHIKKTRAEKIRLIAHRVYLNRMLSKKNSNADDDWGRAEKIYKNPIRRCAFLFNQPLLYTEKKAIEPTARWLDRADLFSIIARVSPAIEALGVLAIPIVLFFATQRYEEASRIQESEKLQQQAVKEYFEQLSNILLSVEGDLNAADNKRLRTLMTADTSTLLREPGLNGERKAQVVKFLSQMELINRPNIYGPKQPGEKVVPVKLSNADLRNAPLDSTTLNGAVLDGVDMSGASLRLTDLEDANLQLAVLENVNFEYASLKNADMHSVKLDGAMLIAADLSGAIIVRSDLSEAELGGFFVQSMSNGVLEDVTVYGTELAGADLMGSDLSNTNLGGANLLGANLRRTVFYKADLRYAANITEEQLASSILCETQLPTEIALNPNRDCEEVERRKSRGGPMHDVMDF